jgi:hypothetical protein
MTAGTGSCYRTNDCTNARTHERVCRTRRLALTRSELSLSLSWGFARARAWMWRCVIARATGGVPAFERSCVPVFVRQARGPALSSSPSSPTPVPRGAWVEFGGRDGPNGAGAAIWGAWDVPPADLGRYRRQWIDNR